jgi:arylsulfatase A-like enzyme
MPAALEKGCYSNATIFKNRACLPNSLLRHGAAALLLLCLASVAAGGGSPASLPYALRPTVPAPPDLQSSRGLVAGASPDAASSLPFRCILISIDTLRYDHVGCNGYSFSTTPNIDSFRTDAVRFADAIAQAPSTLSSHASMLTSLLGPQHGASFKRGTGLAADVQTLAAALREHGAATVSFNEGGQLAPEYGLGRGFDRYSSTAVGPGTASLASEVQNAVFWLQHHPGRSCFVFLHTYEVHHPYTPDERHLALIEPVPYHGRLPAGGTPLQVLDAVNQGFLRLSADDLRHVVATYDAQIRAMDDGFGELVAYLKQQGLYDATTIVFTSDHGEEFGEHGRIGWHSHTLYDELLRVPLLIKYPHGAHAGATVTRQVRSIDIAPTILALLGAPRPGRFQGRDLTPLAAGRREPARFAVSNLDGGGVPAIRTQRWKLIGNHLFDLAADPGETRDVSARYPEIAAYLAARRTTLLAAAPAAAGPAAGFAADSRAHLNVLGYVGAAPRER